MTPLAHQVFKQLMLPRNDRVIENRCDCPLIELMSDVHYFDCRKVTQAAVELFKNSDLAPDEFRRQVKTSNFLPAKNTWLEADPQAPNLPGCRMAYLLRTGEDAVRVYGILRTADRFAAAWLQFDVPIGQESPADDWLRGAEPGHPSRTTYSEILGMLALVNTPRIIGRRQHQPHAGLRRDLSRKFGAGAFVLHPWTEIVLKITPPSSEADEPETLPLTGSRALHFVRAHLRMRLGRVEIVSPHWRGDPALGIKQSRYRVED